MPSAIYDEQFNKHGVTQWLVFDGVWPEYVMSSLHKVLNGDAPRRIKEAAGRHARALERAVYRCVAPQWARPEHLLSGEGSRANGGRWMRRGVAAVTYASSNELIALKEARNNFTRYGIQSRIIAPPRLSVQIEVRFSEIVYLTELLEELGRPGMEELLSEDWEAANLGALCQAVGRTLFEAGLEGMLVPSVRDQRGFNLVWFPENLQESSRQKIVGEEELARWIAK